MMVVIDNYDSFTYNLVQYLGELGIETTVFRNDRVSVLEIEGLRPAGIIISPGPGRPEGAGITVEAIRHFAGAVPILGVCLGHQGIAQAYGGRIVSADVLMHGKTSLIHHDGATIYRDLECPFRATRYHSLVVQRENLPDCLEISAWTQDGTIMGVRHREDLVEGVQFHPESILTEVGKNLLRNFIDLSAEKCRDVHFRKKGIER